VIEAKLLIAPGCQYCTTMMDLLGTLLKEGRISSLLMINIAVQPDVAVEHNVRSVPWLKIGKMEFSGVQTRVDLERALDRVVRDDGLQQYFFDRLKEGRLDEIISQVDQDKTLLPDLIALLKGEEVPMAVRIGVSAILEGFQKSPSVLKKILPQLLELSRSSDETVRADACHFLSLESSDEAIARIQECTRDDSTMVREVAEEALQEM